MRSHGIRRILVLLAAMGLALAPLAGTPMTCSSAGEEFDPAFDGDGKLLTPLGHESVEARAVLVQPGDEKILVAGSVSGDGDWDFVLLRYCTDGSMDDGANCGRPGFGTGGRVITDFGGGSYDFAYDAALQADGKIVVVGSSGGDMAVARYNPDGSLDATFDSDGMVKVDFQSAYDYGHAVAVQPDGKIVVGGETTITTWSDFALARLCPNGALDNGSTAALPASAPAAR